MRELLGMVLVGEQAVGLLAGEVPANIIDGETVLVEKLVYGHEAATIALPPVVVNLPETW
jgi:hypothetical protein